MDLAVEEEMGYSEQRGETENEQPTKAEDQMAPPKATVRMLLLEMNCDIVENESRNPMCGMQLLACTPERTYSESNEKPDGNDFLEVTPPNFSFGGCLPYSS